MDIKLTFIIPVINPRACKSWDKVLDRLQETLQSIDNAVMADKRYWIAIVVNKGACLDTLRTPDNTRIIEVDLPPPAVSVYKGESDEAERMKALTYDKGFKVASGARWARSVGSTFIMSVDADDLISRKLPGFLTDDVSQSSGWYIEKGWILDHSSLWAILVTDFHEWCGTFSVVRTDLLETDKPVDCLPEDYVRDIYGNHKMLVSHMESIGHALQPFPFPAAAYVVGHTGGTYRRSSFIPRALRLENLRENPKGYVKRLFRIRYFFARMRNQFGIVRPG